MKQCHLCLSSRTACVDCEFVCIGVQHRAVMAAAMQMADRLVTESKALILICCSGILQNRKGLNTWLRSKALLSFGCKPTNKTTSNLNSELVFYATINEHEIFWIVTNLMFTPGTFFTNTENPNKSHSICRCINPIVYASTAPTTTIYTFGHKNVPLYFCLYLRQLLTHF